MDIIRTLAFDLLSAIRSIHRLGFVYGDICPQNILAFKGGFKIINLGNASLPQHKIISKTSPRNPRLKKVTNEKCEEPNSPLSSDSTIEVSSPKPKITITTKSQEVLEAEKQFKQKAEIIKSGKRLIIEREKIEKYGYKAPEVLLDKDIDIKSDIWSIGVVLAEIVSGRKIFDGKGKKSILEQQKGILFMNELPLTNKQLQTFLETHDSQICDLIIKCLAMKSNERPSANELLQHPFFNGDFKSVNGEIIEHHHI